MLTAVQLEAYFKKIGLAPLYRAFVDKRFALSHANLRVITLRHALTFPFENIDMHDRTHPKNPPISSRIDDVFEKMVIGNRGGYCYETNVLLGEVLRTLGFCVKSYHAGLWLLREHKTEPYHLLNTVCVDQDEYMVDPGFGNPGPIEPLLLFKKGKLYTTEQKFPQHTVQAFRFVPDGSEFQLQSTVELPVPWRPESPFKPLYAFSTASEVSPEEIAKANLMVCSSEQSPFLERLFITKAIPLAENHTGRMTLNNQNLKIVKGKVTEESKIGSKTDFLTALTTHFGISLPQTCDFSRFKVKFEQPEEKLKQLAEMLATTSEQITFPTTPPTPPTPAVTFAYSSMEETPVVTGTKPAEPAARVDRKYQ